MQMTGSKDSLHSHWWLSSYLRKIWVYRCHSIANITDCNCDALLFYTDYNCDTYYSTFEKCKITVNCTCIIKWHAPFSPFHPLSFSIQIVRVKCFTFQSERPFILVYFTTAFSNPIVIRLSSAPAPVQILNLAGRLCTSFSPYLLVRLGMKTSPWKWISI